ncbi:DUF4224 domain-containing protein [Noviherbaspirillum aridicola]|uniref:DUF4224 domain-containing protein n=1 Tax=Noviherbaspirillum aridicola TaxID=2849687 RepID=A0ABQ4QAE5_9BURK|nr:DUF4224 domain-containing protein [Noviherbaspirillum aridicola]GIZ54047.1 hypothetical protein NCCP691_40610 [Noviherbaspirillum aridicola]
MDVPFLDRDEIAALTGKRRRSSQREVLNALGITHKVRPDGSILILWAHVTQVLGGEAAKGRAPGIEPNWDAMNARDW